MGCLPSQAAVIVALTWLCVLTASAAALGEACDPNNFTCNTDGNEICKTDNCSCNTGYFYVSGECKSDVISVVLDPSSSVVYGSDVNLTATIKSDVPVSLIIWQRVISNGVPQNLDTKDGDTESGTVTLTIKNVDFNDTGTYQVYVNNTAGNANTSNQVSVTVTGGELTITTGANVTGRVGGNVTVDCNITGPELDSVLWKKYTLDNTNVEDLTIDGTKYTVGPIHTPALTIKNLIESDAAGYECTAHNPGGNYSSSNKATVTVKYGQFQEPCSNTEPCDNTKDLECNDSKCLCKSSHYHKEKVCYEKSRLAPVIKGLNSTNNTFSVFWDGSTTDGHLVNGFELHWRALDGANQTAQFDRDTKMYTVSSGLMSGQLYIVGVKSLVNLTDPEDYFSVSSAEGKVRLKTLPPGAISGNTFPHDNLMISWAAPDNTVVTVYEVTIDGTMQTTSNSSSSINFTAKKLVPGEYYNVSIVTVSGTDDVEKSSPHIEQIKITPTKPDPPTEVRCTEELDTYIVLSWKAPSNPNGLIKHYQINISPAADQGEKINTSTNTTIKKVEGLSPEKTYEVSVSTVNDAADSISNASISTSCRTKAGVSGPPTELEIKALKSRTFNITFRAPDEVNGVLAAYKILIWKGVNQCVQQILVGGGIDCANCTSTDGCPLLQNDTVTDISLPVEYTVTGLNPYTKYLVGVAAVNGQGEGHRANISAMTEEEIPLKPEKITAEIFNATSLTLSWNISDPSPGNTTYTIYVYESMDDKGTNFTLKQTLKSYGFSQKSVKVFNLEEYWPYNFKVNAATVKGNRTSDTSTFRTSQAAPGKVLNLTVFQKGEDYRKAYVSWSLPPLRDHNGVLQIYVLRTNFTGKSERENLTVNLSHQDVEKSFNVTPEEVYDVKVALQNNESMEGSSSTQFYTAPAGPPPRPSVDLIATEPGKHKPTDKTISLEIDYSFFKNEENGKQVLFGISVCAVPKCDGHNRKWKEEWENLPNWHDAMKKDFPDYLVTNGTFMEGVTKGGSRKKRSIDLKLFVIGNDSTCASLEEKVYCNGPLKSGTPYRVTIFACTNGGCSQFTSSEPYETNVVPVDPEGPPLGIIIGVVGAVVVVVLIIAVVIFIKRRSSSKGKPYTEKIVNPTDPEDSITKNIPRKRPIRLKELAEKVAEKHKDSNLHFAREYDDLKALCAKHSTVTSETDSNKLKNRYVNILPFDHSRVKLMLTEDDDPSTDFINANYLPGYKSPREYIATQGPIPGTIDDFWRMIWEQNVSIIVMLTLCKEEGRVKCEMYWPENTNEPKQYGDLVVETVSNSTVNFYDFRIFKIKLGDTTRSVKHFHFLQWKDFSANVQNDVMIDFIKNVRNHIRPPDMNGPVVVHCSAGVGRTGTYCALDHLFQFIDEHELDESIDIFDLVMNLREQRMCMVQTEQQYVFIHDCVRDYVERKQREMNGNQLYENVNRAFVHDDVEEDESLYQNYNNQRTDL